MNQADSLWDETGEIFSRWNLQEIPFSESASSLQSNLEKVFTGRNSELKRVFQLLRGRERKRILVYGWVGIGKTAFLLEVLAVLRRKSKDTLTAYISLPPQTDLATAALIALAQEMESDQWAQELLNQMGLISKKPLRKTKTKLEGKIGGIGGSREEETISVAPLQFPLLSFQDLLKKALKKYKKVVIAIDDLDKQDPARVRQLLHDAQGMLKGDAWFLLTGHPSGLTQELLIRERGLFDLAIELKQLDPQTTYRMLINYLSSARIEETSVELESPDAVHPFTKETAKILCDRSEGVPRWFNRMANYILLKAAELEAEKIELDILQQGLEYGRQELRGQELTAEDYYVLDLVLEKGVLSDANISLDDLERVKVQEFAQILPILDKLVQLDMVRRLPTERATEYGPNPMVLPE